MYLGPSIIVVHTIQRQTTFRSALRHPTAGSQYTDIFTWPMSRKQDVEKNSQIIGLIENLETLKRPLLFSCPSKEETSYVLFREHEENLFSSLERSREKRRDPSLESVDQQSEDSLPSRVSRLSSIES